MNQGFASSQNSERESFFQAENNRVPPWGKQWNHKKGDDLKPIDGGTGHIYARLGLHDVSMPDDWDSTCGFITPGAEEKTSCIWTTSLVDRDCWWLGILTAIFHNFASYDILCACFPILRRSHHESSPASLSDIQCYRNCWKQRCSSSLEIVTWSSCSLILVQATAGSLSEESFFLLGSCPHLWAAQISGHWLRLANDFLVRSHRVWCEWRWVKGRQKTKPQSYLEGITKVFGSYLFQRYYHVVYLEGINLSSCNIHTTSIITKVFWSSPEPLDFDPSHLRPP